MPPRPSVENPSQKPIEFKSLKDVGLAKHTLLILENQFYLPDSPSKNQVKAAVEHFSALLFPDDEPHHGWVLDHANNELVDLSYLVTTPEGKQFMSHYRYLHHLVGVLFAHAPREIGNAGMLYGDKRYIFQFPNEYHLQFVQKLLVLPRVTDNWEVEVFGGLLGQQYITAVREYITLMAEVADGLKPASVEFAVQMSFFGVETAVGELLRKVSPRRVQGWRGGSKAGDVFMARRAEARADLLRASATAGNPGLLLEYLEGYFVEDQHIFKDPEAKRDLQYDLNNYEGTRVLEFIRALKMMANELYQDYAQQLLHKITILQSAGLKVPQVVIDAVSNVR